MSRARKFKVISRTALILFLLELATIASNLTIRADETIPTMVSGNSWDVFYRAENLSNENFTIVVLPDTQYYSERYPWIFDNQTQWIVENSERLNIVFVSHVGDLVEHWGDTTEWENANNSMSKLDENVPWGVLPGNHDGFYGNLTNYNKYFGYDRFSDKSWYGGAYQDNSINSYQLFSAGGEDYLIFHLQTRPSDDILVWANETIGNHPNRKVIVTTHEYMLGHGTDQRSPFGEEMWQKLVKPNADQVFLVLCGHNYKETRRTDIVNGHVVHQLLANYQYGTNGGNGWLRILEFSPRDDKIFVKTYSPYLNKFETDPSSQFTLDVNVTDLDDNLLPIRIALISIVLGAVIAVVAIYFKHRRSS